MLKQIDGRERECIIIYLGKLKPGKDVEDAIVRIDKDDEKKFSEDIMQKKMISYCENVKMLEDAMAEDTTYKYEEMIHTGKFAEGRDGEPVGIQFFCSLCEWNHLCRGY